MERGAAACKCAEGASGEAVAAAAAAAAKTTGAAATVCGQVAGQVVTETTGAAGVVGTGAAAVAATTERALGGEAEEARAGGSAFDPLRIRIHRTHAEAALLRAESRTEEAAWAAAEALRKAAAQGAKVAPAKAAAEEVRAVANAAAGVAEAKARRSRQAAQRLHAKRAPLSIRVRRVDGLRPTEQGERQAAPEAYVRLLVMELGSVEGEAGPHDAPRELFRFQTARAAPGCAATWEKEVFALPPFEWAATRLVLQARGSSGGPAVHSMPAPWLRLIPQPPLRPLRCDPGAGWEAGLRARRRPRRVAVQLRPVGRRAAAVGQQHSH